jgi:hypothetical protein
MAMRLARRIRRLAFAWAALAVLMPMQAYAQGSESAEQQLAAKYSPLLSLDPQSKPCGSGEAYRPTVVDIALGRQSVVLRDVRGAVVKRGPTSADLWRHADVGYYLDFPGDPLNPGCSYEKQFRDWNDGRKPSVYAHVATDPRYLRDCARAAC